jgi:hypothetical protein
MDEVVPGIFHWTAYRASIGTDVHSHYVLASRAVLDPMVPPEGLEWFEDGRRPERIVLTQRHHWRDCPRFVGAFGVPVLCQEDGARLIEAGRTVEPFAFGEEPAPGIAAYPVWPEGWPGETALHIRDAGALALADAVIRDDRGALAFVPDSLLGDDPAEARRELTAGLARLVDELDFDTLLLAHGAPAAASGRDELRAFVAGQ